MTLAPIVLFVYNRPRHTELTLEALMLNELANESILYIYADGSKNKSGISENEILETRNVIRKKQWCKEVIIIETDVNKGLADSIIDGVTEVINQHEKVIVLEDDIITSKGFLRYMNESLHLFKDELKLMHVSAYSYPLNLKNQFFLMPGGTCWGWGTWKRAWVLLNTDAFYHEKWIREANLIHRFNFKGSKALYTQLLDNVTGTRKTWAILWRATIFKNQSYTLYPPISLTRNIGTDGSGTHKENDKKIKSQKMDSSYIPYYQKVKMQPDIENKIQRYYLGKSNKGESFFRKIINKIKL